jgi:ABC-type transport system substrate-binding protein
MGKRLPIADVIHFRIIAESQASFLSFLAGGLDVSGLDKDQFDKAISPQQEVTPQLDEKNIKLQRYAEATIHYISFNMNDTTVGTPAGEKGRAIRRAMALGFPREDYISRYLNNRGSAAEQVVPPGMKGHQPSNRMPSQHYDAAAGRKVLQNGGFEVRTKGTAFEAIDPATGKPVTITVSFRSTAETTKQYATFLASAAAQVGIIVQPELLTFSELLKRQDDGKGQAYDAGWVMDYPDAQNMLQLLYGPNKPPGINSAAYASAEYDRLYEEMSVLDDNIEVQLARKLFLIEKMHAVLEHDTPWVLIEYRVIYALYHDWHLISKPNEFAYTYYKFWYSDSNRRSEMAAQWNSAPVLPALILILLTMIPVVLVGLKIARQA